jgi:UrcA family protein
MSSKTVSRSARPLSIQAVVIGAAALGAFLGLAIPAHADVPPKQQSVDYQDLDLTREQDVQRLYSRLRGAARGVCSSVDGRTRFERAQYRECYDQALTRAVNEVNVTQLSKLHGSSATPRVAQRR